MTTAQVVETSVTVKKNSPIQDYVHPDDHTQPTLEKVMKIRWSPKKNVLTFFEIFLNYFLPEMYGDQSGEFLVGYHESRLVWLCELSQAPAHYTYARTYDDCNRVQCCA